MKCPVCGKYNFKEDFDVCPVCYWQNDRVQMEYPDMHGANSMTIGEARENYKKYGMVFTKEEYEELMKLDEATK